MCIGFVSWGGASRAESDSSTRADGSGNRRCFRSSPVSRPTSRFRPPPTTSIPPGRGHLDDIDSASHRLTHLRTASPRTSAVGSACTWSGPPARLSARARGTVPGAREGAGSCRPDRCAALKHASDAQLNQDVNPRPQGAAAARKRMVVTCVLLGFWRFVIGLCSRKHAIARLGPPWPALAVVWGWFCVRRDRD